MTSRSHRQTAHPLPCQKYIEGRHKKLLRHLTHYSLSFTGRGSAKFVLNFSTSVAFECRHLEMDRAMYVCEVKHICVDRRLSAYLHSPPQIWYTEWAKK